ncbi:MULTISPECIES: hypothetical protein [unclassified Novosphingobium]|uniref:hypothetical protein n=1 Tax=unclassified Novosphingobium TaxID=2644732 RepID=UPI0012E2E0E4|nr:MULTISPECIES: hypothetical protein [unclassified Novosphingobium]MBB3360367.1 hypothetical protein [Novosphingobium sp. BK256]MBB3381119.1 hypothetical protein [Novosphingobium sp. BK258]MBB3654544.1 hypothetical protein [Novosphingobium sp. BK626]MBB3376706.1 hypothetical protein [Novosphingobium sp. BK280]MBB3422770.1 hypothetical protein [Novosphingobium sp. BK267]
MSILRNWKHGLFVLAMVGCSAGCDRGSPAYRQIEKLPYSEWDRYAASLPIEKRLDLQKEIMERSGANPQMTIEGAFSKQPSETYEALINRIKRGDHSRYYLGVIYEINRSDKFEICSQPDRRIIQSYLRGIAGYPGQERQQPDFYNC